MCFAILDDVACSCRISPLIFCSESVYRCMSRRRRLPVYVKKKRRNFGSRRCCVLL